MNAALCIPVRCTLFRVRHCSTYTRIDLKPDNILVALGSEWTTEAIDSWLASNPPEFYDPEQSLTKTVVVTKSKSLPLPSIDSLESADFKLADFSSGGCQVLTTSCIFRNFLHSPIC